MGGIILAIGAVILCVFVIFIRPQVTPKGMALRNGNKRIVIKNHRQKGK